VAIFILEQGGRRMEKYVSKMPFLDGIKKWIPVINRDPIINQSKNEQYI